MATTRRTDNAGALARVVRELTLHTDSDSILDDMLKVCRAVSGADEVSIARVEGDELVEDERDTAYPSREPVRLKIGVDGLGGLCAAKGRTIIVPDVAKDRRYFKANADTRSEALVPVFFGPRLAGVLDFESSKRGFFKRASQDLLELLASQVAVALRLDEARRRQERLGMELGMLNNLGRAGTSLAPREHIQRCADLVRRTFDCSYTAVFLGDYEGRRIVLLAHSPEDSEDVRPGASLPFGRGLIGTAFRLGETVNTRDVRKDRDYVSTIPTTRSELDVPIRAGDRCLGILDAQSNHVDSFTDDEVQALETLARFLVPALQHVESRA
jgi:putative methionine-R-sulfoxide reductase with GAF domain